MANELLPVRRIVAAINDEGRSFIAEDGPPKAVRENPARPGVRVCHAWDDRALNLRGAPGPSPRRTPAPSASA